MSVRRSGWQQGIPSWVDLTTNDIAATAAFYRQVLNWTATSVPGSMKRDYVVLRVGEAAVAGMRSRPDDAPTGWTVYLATDDVESSVARAVALGATVVSPPKDVEILYELESPLPAAALGRKAVLADPQGAVVGLWQGGTLNGSQLVNKPGGLCWEELYSSDPVGAAGFYTSLFNYAFEPEPPYGPDYMSFRLQDERVGLGGVRAVGSNSVPAGWLPFFGVADADAASRSAQAQGGSVILPTFATPRDQVALLADPGGDPFWVVTSTGQDQPDRTC